MDEKLVINVVFIELTQNMEEKYNNKVLRWYNYAISTW